MMRLWCCIVNNMVQMYPDQGTTVSTTIVLYFCDNNTLFCFCHSLMGYLVSAEPQNWPPWGSLMSYCRLK